MSESIDTIRVQLWEKMRTKTYRDTFVAAHLSTNIAAQIQTMRESRGWKQKDLADRAEMTPARISVMEDPSYDKFTLSTLKRLASAFDVAFVARFVPFSELAVWSADLSREKLDVRPFDQDALPLIGQAQLQPGGYMAPMSVFSGTPITGTTIYHSQASGMTGALTQLPALGGTITFPGSSGQEPPSLLNIQPAKQPDTYQPAQRSAA